MRKTMFAASESGFINKNIFISWMRECLLRYCVKVRASASLNSGYSGPVHVILDGCSAHLGGEIEAICGDNVRLHFLPPHSSHLTQPLDLVTFGLLKNRYKNIRVDGGNYSRQSAHILRVLASLYQVAVPHLVVAAFKAAGIGGMVVRGTMSCVATVSIRDAPKVQEYITTRSQVEEVAEAEEQPGTQLIWSFHTDIDDTIPLSESFLIRGDDEFHQIDPRTLVFSHQEPMETDNSLHCGWDGEEAEAAAAVVKRRIMLPIDGGILRNDCGVLPDTDTNSSIVSSEHNPTLIEAAAVAAAAIGTTTRRKRGGYRPRTSGKILRGRGDLGTVLSNRNTQTEPPQPGPQ